MSRSDQNQHAPTRSALRRAQIEQTAVQLFRTQGYEGTTLSMIAEQIGITAPALYRHYRSKEELLVACLEHTQQRLLDRTAAAVTATDPVERLQQFVRVHVGFQLDEFEAAQLFGGAVYGTLLLSESLPAERQARLREMEQTQLDTLRDILHAGIDAGVFDAVSVTPTAFAIIGMGEHTSLWYRPDGELQSAQIANLYADLATKMVLKEPLPEERPRDSTSHGREGRLLQPVERPSTTTLEEPGSTMNHEKYVRVHELRNEG